MLPTTPFQFLLYFVRKQQTKFLILILIAAIWAINDSLFPFFLKLIVNALQAYQGKTAGAYRAVAGVVSLLILFWIVTESLLRTQGIVGIYLFPYFRADIREAVFNYVKSHSHEYFSSHFAGNLTKKLADLPMSCQVLMEIICFQFTTAATGACLILIMMWLTHPLFAYILLTWLCLHLTLAALLLIYGNPLWEVHSDANSALSGKIVDVFTNILNVRVFARGPYEIQYLRQFQNDEIAKAQKAMWLVESMRVGMGISGLFLIFSMVLTLIYAWSHRWITIGDFTQIMMQSFWLLGWIWFVSYQITVFAREMGTIRDALMLVKKGHDVVDPPNAVPIIIKQGKIRFEQVCFAYRKNHVVFNDLNVVIPAGQKVGLVGFSGSGKSTFLNLILRFYDLQAGRILIDNQDIAKVTQDSLRTQIAMIPQDPTLFHRSLIENIRYGRLTATDEEIIEAARLAHCHEFIEKLEDGYQSLVGERGLKLSGGQRQRIAIARAILKNAPILILDEATSSLDTVTEKLIQESLHQLMEGRTTIVIAHRLSTLADMDRILVFHKGEIVEEGTKESLLKNKGYFAMLWDMQTNGFLPNS